LSLEIHAVLAKPLHFENHFAYKTRKARPKKLLSSGLDFGKTKNNL
jgi:hypothetical protein